MTKSATTFVTMMIYDEISNYVRNNDAIPQGIKYNVHMKMKQEYIDKATNDYKYL